MPGNSNEFRHVTPDEVISQLHDEIKRLRTENLELRKALDLVHDKETGETENLSPDYKAYLALGYHLD